MDLQKVNNYAIRTIFKDKSAFLNIKSKFPVSDVESSNKKDISNFYFNNDIEKGGINEKLFKPISRRQRRRLSKEQRFSQEIRTLSSKEGGIREKKKISKKYTSSINLPWIDSSLWTSIASVFPSPLPSVQPKISRRTIAEKDREICDDYLSYQRDIRNCWFTCFSTSACHAANHLGIISFNKRSKRNVLPISNAVDYTSKNTNSGTPFLMKKSDPKNISWVKKMLRDLFRNPSKGKLRNAFTSGLTFDTKGLQQRFFELPQLLFRRTQIAAKEGEIKIKPRVVWCIPHIIVALEAMFFYEPLQNCILKSQNDSRYPYSIGQRNRLISESIRRLRSDCIKTGKSSIYSLDYSGYDRTIPLFFFDIFFSIMREDLQLSSHEEFIYDTLRLYIKHTPMIVNDVLTFKTRGVSSGLFITNLFDSLVNLTLIKMTEILFYEFKPMYDLIDKSDKSVFNQKYDTRSFVHCSSICYNNYRVLGDDGIVYWSENLVNFLRKMCFQIGMELSIKSICHDIDSGDIFYLGRYWDKDNIPDQTKEYMAAHIVFRTKFYKEADVNFDIKDLDVMRILSICLPLKSGREFINTYLKDYEPLNYLIENKKDFYFLKEWPSDEYQRFKYDEIPYDVLDF